MLLCSLPLCRGVGVDVTHRESLTLLQLYINKSINQLSAHLFCFCS